MPGQTKDTTFLLAVGDMLVEFVFTANVHDLWGALTLE